MSIATKLSPDMAMVIYAGKQHFLPFLIEDIKANSEKDVLVKLMAHGWKEVVLMYLEENEYRVDDYGQILKISWRA